MTGKLALPRRSLAHAAALAALVAAPARAADAPQVAAEEHWAEEKGEVRLYLYRKRVADGAGGKPALFLVHG